MKNFLTIAFLFIAGLAFAQPVRTTITDDGVNVTISTPVNSRVIPICDFHWTFVDGQLQMWIEGRNELIPGGRLGNFTINGATTQATKLAALGAISAQCAGGGGGLDSLYLADGTLLSNGDTITSTLPYYVYVASIFQTSEDNPVVTVFENTLGGSVSWTRDGIGDYRGTLVNAFPPGKIWCNLSIYGPIGSSFAFFARANELGSPDAIRIDVLDDTFSPTDLAGLSIMIEIRIYP